MYLDFRKLYKPLSAYIYFEVKYILQCSLCVSNINTVSLVRFHFASSGVIARRIFFFLSVLN